MCGICGIVYPVGSQRVVDESILTRMRDILFHRGPDEAGSFIANNIGLGHRRLSIVDLRSGQQPMRSPDSDCVITYNGEIYNHSELRSELEQKGHRYVSNSDTETILHLYEEYGPACVEKLRGMFAFAIWDAAKKTLFVARDRLGIKPLYYVHGNDGSLYFASEIKALIEAGAIKPELNFDALPDQFANHGTSFDETLFLGVNRLLPGHFLIWNDGKLHIEEFWDLSFEPKYEYRNENDLVEEWKDLFQKSVELRLMADVPLGMFLSGGIDSSAICAMMARLVDGPIKTFSVGFKEREANEFEYARIVAKAFKTDHHEITITPEQYFAELPDLIWHEDEPLGFVASIPLYFVSQLAQRHVKVVLTGEGSDEILAGYGRYPKTLALLRYGRKYEEISPAFVRSAVKSGIASLPYALNSKLSRTFFTRNADLEGLYWDNFAVTPRSLQQKIFSRTTKDRIVNLDPHQGSKKWLSRSDARSLLDKLLYCDSKTYLHELLMKQDQMSMAASIESRVPFLDHKLVEFTSRLPDHLKLNKNNTKWILRKAMEGILPASIVDREKMGFPVPIERWLNGKFSILIEELLLSERTLSREIFDQKAVQQAVVKFRTHPHGMGQFMWSMINFEVWNRVFIDQEPRESVFKFLRSDQVTK